MQQQSEWNAPKASEHVQVFGCLNNDERLQQMKEVLKKFNAEQSKQRIHFHKINNLCNITLSIEVRKRSPRAEVTQRRDQTFCIIVIRQFDIIPVIVTKFCITVTRQFDIIVTRQVSQHSYQTMLYDSYQTIVYHSYLTV